MVQGEEIIDLLQDLGLSPSQAKVYLTLVTSGCSTAGQTYKTAHVARQDIYRILIELQQIGLVEKVIAAPTQFKPISLHESVSILTEQKIKEASKLKLKAKELIKDVNEEIKPANHPEGLEFVIIPEKMIDLKIEKAIEHTKKSLDFILSKEKIFWIFRAEETLMKLIQRDVKIRFIIDKTEDEMDLPGIIKESCYAPFSSLKGKYAFTPPSVHLAVIDNELIFFDILSANTRSKAPVLWSNNNCLIVLAQNYFDQLWQRGIDFPEKKLVLGKTFPFIT